MRLSTAARHRREDVIERSDAGIRATPEAGTRTVPARRAAAPRDPAPGAREPAVERSR